MPLLPSMGPFVFYGPFIFLFLVSYIIPKKVNFFPGKFSWESEYTRSYPGAFFNCVAYPLVCLLKERGIGS